MSEEDKEQPLIAIHIELKGRDSSPVTQIRLREPMEGLHLAQLLHLVTGQLLQQGAKTFPSVEQVKAQQHLSEVMRDYPATHFWEASGLALCAPCEDTYGEGLEGQPILLSKLPNASPMPCEFHLHPEKRPGASDDISC